jgi:hypothetical protein
MKRLAASIAMAVLGLSALAACEKPVEPVAPAAPTEPAAPATPAPEETAMPPVTPTPDTRVAAMNLMCGGESFRVAFEDSKATLIGADGVNVDLPLLPPAADAPPGPTTYTNGKMTFTKEGGRDTPTVVKYARGKMAFQDCAIAVN